MIEVHELKAKLETARNTAQHIGEIILPIIEDANQALATINPELAEGNSELKHTWPLTNEYLFKESLQKHFFANIRKMTGEEEQVPLPIYSGAQRYFAIGDFYPYKDKVEGQTFLRDDDIPEVSAQYVRDLSDWTAAMSARGGMILTSVNLPSSGHEPIVSIYSDTTPARDYLAQQLPLEPNRVPGQRLFMSSVPESTRLALDI